MGFSSSRPFLYHRQETVALALLRKSGKGTGINLISYIRIRGVSAAICGLGPGI
jgi:hypothetical protein